MKTNRREKSYQSIFTKNQAHISLKSKTAFCSSLLTIFAFYLERFVQGRKGNILNSARFKMFSRKPKRKRYFSSNLMAKKKKDLCLQADLKGFISTCNGMEGQCVRESYNILNEYADKLFGEEKVYTEKLEFVYAKQRLH